MKYKTIMFVVMLFIMSAIVYAEPPVKEDGFICPVLGGKAGMNGNSEKIVQPPGGFYSVIGPSVNVPVHATNGDGAGSPAGPFSSPGDTDYTAIWNTE